MHDAGIGSGAVFLGQDAGHVVVGVAGMDDQGQAGLARGLDMNAQAVLLDRLAVGGVVIVQPGFADARRTWGGGRGVTRSSTVTSGSLAALIGWVPAA